MRAIICPKYGSPDVLELREIPKPVPKDHEILVKIHATTVNSGDCRVRGLDVAWVYRILIRLFMGIKRPRKSILGVELSGEVEAVGSKVSRYKKGDQIFAFKGMAFGTYAEYICLSEDELVAKKPSNVTYEEAAGISFGGTTALHFFRKANIQQGQKVLIYGASGATGTAAVQLAKYFGAEVTAVCSGANVELVKSLGADHVIDYKREDFTISKEQVDIVFDAVGKVSKSKCAKILKPSGRFLSVQGQGIVKVLPEDMSLLKQLMESGQIRTVIDRSYPLEQISDAHRYVDQGHKKGSVVINVI